MNETDFSELAKFVQAHSLYDLYSMARRERPLILSGMERVVGGYIGEKLSKDSPDNVWETLLHDDVTQMIDLRYGHIPQQFISRCEEYGISYFRYPIHNDPETIANMVENFPKFDKLLRAGHFYMQGRHTSYVMLYIYQKLTKRTVISSYEMERIGRDTQLMKRIAPLLKAMREQLGIQETEKPEKRVELASLEYCDGPETESFSIINFKRAFRNETTVYDISIEEFGTIGYLYVPKERYGLWEYDIVLRPSESGKARNFRDAQIKIAKHLRQSLPFSPKWATLPESVKMKVIEFEDLRVSGLPLQP